MNNHCVFPEISVVFVHIPKTAGTSMRAFLYQITQSWTPEHKGNPHATASELKKEHANQWDSFLKLALMRDPVERFASAYHYFKRLKKLWDEGNEVGHISDYKTGQKIGDATLGDLINNMDILEGYTLHFRPQVNFLDEKLNWVSTDIPATVKRIEDHVGEKIMLGGDKIVFPHKNTNNQKYEVSDEDSKKIQEYYAEDYEYINKCIHQK